MKGRWLLRTMLRNRIHCLLGAQHEVKLPQCSDLFSSKGLSFLEKLAARTRLEEDAPYKRGKASLRDSCENLKRTTTRFRGRTARGAGEALKG